MLAVMTFLRYVLLTTSFLSATAAVFFAKTEAQTITDGMILLAIAFLLGLNWYYLLECAKPAKSRLGRMISLWLEAKEAELKRRANPAD